MAEKNYGRLIKALQIAAGIFMLSMVVLCLVLTKKYNIKVTNIPQICEQITGGVLTITLGAIFFSVVKSFALIFPPAVVFSVCAYLLPNFWLALAVNIISGFLSLSIPYFLGKFTGSGMVDTLKGKFKAVKKLDDFAGANEIQMTFVVKLSGIIPGDLSSLLFGAMGISYKSFMIGGNLGTIPLAFVYSFFGFTLKNIGQQPWVVAIPVAVIVLFATVASLITKKLIEKTKAEKAKQN